MQVPQAVGHMLQALETEGYEAYLVGGCVRDSLLNAEPKDYDITTSARPENATKALEKAGCRVHPTGIAHGTVTAVYDGMAVEITAYRIDGEYRDHRHPEKVQFVGELKQDLLRRDFTCNALAYNPRVGLVDLVGGLEDLKLGVLRCVGEARHRFEEDALRILRALRFSSVLGFSIEESTAAAIHKKADLLKSVARERISAEVCKLVCGIQASQVLKEYRDVLEVCLSGMKDVSCKTYCLAIEKLSALPPHPLLRLYPLLDISNDQIGDLQSLRLSGRQQETLQVLLDEGKEEIRNLAEVRRCLGKYGEENTRLLLTLQGGKALSILETAVDQKLCCSISQLAVKGKDLQTLALKGPVIGDMLRFLLNEVIEDRLENKKEPLLIAARRRMDQNDGCNGGA